MKTVETYIVELLKEHECVVMPDFGGFVLNPMPARFAGTAHELRPPGKVVSFNINLNLNDGLLAQHIAQAEGISYTEALNHLLETTEAWKKSLYSERSLTLAELGKVSLTEDYKWLFDPDGRHNFDKAAFGLVALQLAPIENTRLLAMQGRGEVKPLPHTWKWLAGSAAAVLLLLAGALGYQRMRQANGQDTPVLAVQEPAKAGDSLEQLLKESEAEVHSMAGSAGNLRYYVIGGSFGTRANAEKFAGQLEKKGYSAEVLGNESGFFRVAYLQDKDSIIADRHLQKIQQEENQSAWILKW